MNHEPEPAFLKDYDRLLHRTPEIGRVNPDDYDQACIELRYYHGQIQSYVAVPAHPLLPVGEEAKLNARLRGMACRVEARLLCLQAARHIAKRLSASPLPQDHPIWRNP